MGTENQGRSQDPPSTPQEKYRVEVPLPGLYGVFLSTERSQELSTSQETQVLWFVCRSNQSPYLTTHPFEVTLPRTNTPPPVDGWTPEVTPPSIDVRESLEQQKRFHATNLLAPSQTRVRTLQQGYSFYHFTSCPDSHSSSLRLLLPPYTSSSLLASRSLRYVETPKCHGPQ